MLLVCRCKWMNFCKRLNERGFSNAARADDCDEFAYMWNYKIIQQFTRVPPCEGAGLARVAYWQNAGASKNSTAVSRVDFKKILD